eukprot:10421244-Ditylum_brightwellii.AAC.1
MHTICKHLKTAVAEVGSVFDLPAIPFIFKSSTLKVEDSQEFNLCIFATKKDNTYTFKAYIFEWFSQGYSRMGKKDVEDHQVQAGGHSGRQV